MAKIGDIAKGVLIFFCGYSLLAAVGQTMSGQIAFSVFMFVGFLKTLITMIGDYLKKTNQT
jgi:hypothetical protein